MLSNFDPLDKQHLWLLLSTSPDHSGRASSRNLTSPAASLHLSNLPTSGRLEDWKIREAERGCSLNSSSCLNDARKISFPAKQLVLPPLCKDTPLQPFILHLAFYCEREFPSVVQDEGLKGRALTWQLDSYQCKWNQLEPQEPKTQSLPNVDCQNVTAADPDPSAVSIEWLCCNLPMLQSDLFQIREQF